MNIAGIGSHATYLNASSAAAPNKSPSSSFAQALASTEAASSRGGETTAQRPDFTSMTGKDFTAWGKDQFAKGNITLDDLFRVQWAAGDFSPTGSAGNPPQNFTKAFQDAMEFQRANGGTNDRNSSFGSYAHLLSVMNGSISITV